MRDGPEQDLVAGFAARIQGIGPQLGVTEFSITRLREKRGQDAGARQAAELTALRDALEKLDQKYGRGVRVALDERGTQLTSRDFAGKLMQWIASGTGHVSFLIGGADGLDDALRRDCDFLLSLGRATWPHMLARAMLCEQIWRALSIQSNHPYHRD